jgi:integrase
MRKVKLPGALLDALRAHRENSALEGSVKGWTPEQRALVFPTPAGRIMRHGHFVESVWQPLLAKSALPYRKYHSTRHSFATWMLDEGADVRWVERWATRRSARRPTPTRIWTAPSTRRALRR